MVYIPPREVRTSTPNSWRVNQPVKTNAVDLALDGSALASRAAKKETKRRSILKKETLSPMLAKLAECTINMLLH
ncbi:hypothetical protein N9U66_00720 [Synechococcus sp. AH-736-M20]|nr:hypothetical protein [Synechococcus sp. AH-736-M20]